jgi:hypothetical protein
MRLGKRAQLRRRGPQVANLEAGLPCSVATFGTAWKQQARKIAPLPATLRNRDMRQPNSDGPARRYRMPRLAGHSPHDDNRRPVRRDVSHAPRRPFRHEELAIVGCAVKFPVGLGGMDLRILWLALLPALAGCSDINNRRDVADNRGQCFSVLQAGSTQPHAPLLVDACEGRTWLLVRGNMSDKPEDGYTYQWFALSRLDYTNPTLVRDLPAPPRPQND